MIGMTGDQAVMDKPAAGEKPAGAERHHKKRSASTSRGFVQWMIRQQVSLVCTSYQTGQLLCVGSRSDGLPMITPARFARAMGLTAFSQRLYLAAQTRLWRLENTLRPNELANERFDRLFVPRNAQVTGDLDVHELAVEPSGRMVFVNTKYGCLATVSMSHAFKPLWKPRFISRLVAEDRCHLNGLGLQDGRARYVTACSTTDVVDGWRDHRRSGGVLINVDTDRVVAEGFSMPHSPRVHGGMVWLLHSGTGWLCRVDPQTGKRENVVFCPGFLRGLAFHGDYAVVTVSMPRRGRFEGLELEDALKERGVAPWCGLLVIDLRQGGIVEWLRFEGEVVELFDVGVVESSRCAMALAPDSPELQDAITFEETFGTPTRGQGAANRPAMDV
jgi:uncharacterized protein (TIGR03032 family)